MFGRGMIKGMGITLRHFFDSYTVGHNKQPAAAGNLPVPPETVIKEGMPTETGGIFTVQYPDQKLPVPERFRYIPFLLYEEQGDGGERDQFDGIRCTACGICAKVCPPQCIWIVRSNDPNTGRPIPEPTEFYIDVDICMNCGFCAEYCPFDAIIMDHDFELASYGRSVFNMEKLLKPASYYKSIRPQQYEQNEAERKAKEAAKAAKAAGAAAAPSA